MPFIIGQHIIPFTKFLNLKSFISKEYYSDIEDFLNIWFDANVESVEMQTSGSTGKPKPISLSKRALSQSALNTISYFELNAGSHALLCLPVKYIAGKMMLVRAILSGMSLHLIEPASRPLIDLQKKIDFTAMTPHQLSLSFQYDNEKINMCHTILLGGAPINNKLQDKIDVSSAEFYLSYGMTETASHVALMNLQDSDLRFKAMKGVGFSTTDDNCLIIHANYLEEAIVTTDVVDLIDAYSFIWKGRKDHIINSGGIKIIPESMEQQLCEIIEFPFLIIGIEEETYGQVPLLLVESEELPEISPIKNAINHAAELAPEKQFPKYISSLSTFYFSESGKINRRMTRDKFIDSEKQVVKFR